MHSKSEIRYYYDKNGIIMATVIPYEYSTSGIKFITNDDSFMQVACMEHGEGYEIQRHYHNPLNRIVGYTCETLIIKKGIMEVNLYDEQILTETFMLRCGDILTLYSGGHGFRMIEPVEMVEIKQGPYLGETDKTRF